MVHYNFLRMRFYYNDVVKGKIIGVTNCSAEDTSYLIIALCPTLDCQALVWVPSRLLKSAAKDIKNSFHLARLKLILII